MITAFYTLAEAIKEIEYHVNITSKTSFKLYKMDGLWYVKVND